MELPKNGRIEVHSPEESEKVQKLLFEHGYRWSSGGTTVGNTRYKYLHWYGEKSGSWQSAMSITHGNNDSSFSDHQNTLVTFDQLFGDYINESYSIF